MHLTYILALYFCFLRPSSGRLKDLEKRIKALEEGKKVKLESCPDGWYQHEKSCYYFSRSMISWFDAMTVCTAFQGYLVEINDSPENSYLAQRVNYLHDNFWLGATDLFKENHWIWANSKIRFTTHVFTDWIKGQPDNSGKNEHCLHMMNTNTVGTWNDVSCTTLGKFICERELQ